MPMLVAPAAMRTSEPGESPDQAVVRECREETGMHVRAASLRRSIRHEYPHGLVDLFYFDCVVDDPTDQPHESTGFRWVEASRLLSLEFPPANEPILRELVASS